MKLLPRYASVCGLKIGKQWLLESFYPLPITRYITLHASSGMAAKNYPLYQEVVAMVLHILESQGIKIVQLGGKDDQLINGCVDLRGKTDYHQSAYILRGSMLHLGNDSWLMHRAGDINVPIVELFGPTSVANHSPYTYAPDKTVFIESHRWGRNPTFASQEAPSSIALIPPEQVANAVLRLLGITDRFTHTTTYIGPLYSGAVMELIPNTVPVAGFCPEIPITVRMDLLFSEETLLALLQTGRKVHIITKRAINGGLLQQARAQILTYTHELTPGADEPPIPYTDLIRSLFPSSHAFFTRASGAALNDLRFTYLDHVTIGAHRDLTKDDYVKSALSYLNRPDTPENRLDIEAKLTHTRFKSNRYILSDSRAFLSRAHFNANQPIDSLASNTGALIDDPAQWEALNHYLITYHP